MVRGIESFRDWFRGHEEQYAIIGGTACDLLMTDGGLEVPALLNFIVSQIPKRGIFRH